MTLRPIFTYTLLKYFASLCIGCSLLSCISHRDLLSIQTNDAKVEYSKIKQHQNEYLLQEGDILSIKVASLDPQSVAIFNKTAQQSNNPQFSEAALYITSYLVSDSGMVNFPIIGDIKVVGLSIPDAEKLVSEKMATYYKFASVDLKLVSFRVTILGEVNQQGTFVFYNTNTNILQAIGQAGGITDMGNRKKVRVIRKKNEESTLAYIDLYSSQLIASDYYQLQPNDIIYVEPLNAKAKRLNLPAIQAILSALTFVVVILTFVQRQ
ncbi:MAG: polysaccharide export protein [Cytophagaceae bacterium]|jgi:polysaccharide export outer membrane protein|nr:polysaccharide export protein [Cytophagaceae bacterium]